MARLFMSGAESGSPGIFDLATGTTASTVQKRTGAYSFYQQNGNVATKAFPANKTVVYVRLALRFVGLATSWGQTTVFTLQDSAGDAQGTICVNPITRIIGYCVGRVSDGVVLSGGLIVLNEWTCLELWLSVVNGAGGRAVVKQDGVTIIDYTGDTQKTALTNVRSFNIGIFTGLNAFEGYFDDLAINDDAGALNNSWIGRGGIVVGLPEEAGTYTDLHASAGDAWDCINEVPPSDADYVSDNAIDQKSTYGLTALVPATGDIACINVIMRALQDAAGTANIARLIRSNGVDSQGSDVGLSVSAKTIQENIETDPGQAPGTAWTIAAVNALQAGAVVR